MDLKHTLIATAARYVVNRLNLPRTPRPQICWRTYVRSGGPILRKQR